jgi:hydroxylamine reductase
MFCYQCEETAHGTGCDKMGVCGKNPDVAGLQDLLIHQLELLGRAAVKALDKNIRFRETDEFVAKAIFMTVTNVNFDPEDITAYIAESYRHRSRLIDTLKKAGVDASALDVEKPETQNHDSLISAAKAVERSVTAASDDIQSLRDTMLFGLKGAAAYADHAQILGVSDNSVYDFFYRALAARLDNSLTVNDWITLVLETGKINLLAMELLDKANTGTYGDPAPTAVPLGHRKGKAIVVSGHDLRDLAELLEQTKGTGITIYTHGEMLPTHGYPGLKKYDHFYGHYGTAWQNQQKEFADFPGAVLMTTNCIRKPREQYQNNIFTSGVVGFPGVVHIKGHDFSPVIKRALELPGFTDDLDKGTVLVGFGHTAVLGVADTVIDLVKQGKIRHFFLVGGCDGAKPGRNYYTEFVEKIPRDCVVLTLACGKFRFFDKQLGDIEGIPRLLDIGQCNDAYSAVQIALALAGAFNTDVNGLPLSLVLSWYEQKAVAVLLTLLSLGVKDIRIGPTPPAFLSGTVMKVLVDTFGLKLITTPDEDLKAILG